MLSNHKLKIIQAIRLHCVSLAHYIPSLKHLDGIEPVCQWTVDTSHGNAVLRWQGPLLTCPIVISIDMYYMEGIKSFYLFIASLVDTRCQKNTLTCWNLMFLASCVHFVEVSALFSLCTSVFKSTNAASVIWGQCIESLGMLRSLIVNRSPPLRPLRGTLTRLSGVHWWQHWPTIGLNFPRQGAFTLFLIFISHDNWAGKNRKQN